MALGAYATDRTTGAEGDNLSRAPVRGLRRSDALRARLTLAPGDVDAGLVDMFGAERVVREGLLPWRRAGAVTVIAAAAPASADIRRDRLEALFGPISLAEAERGDIEAAVLSIRRGAISSRAEDRTPARLSARSFGARRLTAFLAAAAIALLIATILAPVAVFAALVVWASFWLLVSTLLRLAATIAAGRARPRKPPAPPADLPCISMLVPLFRERDIAGTLVRRLSAVDYPADRLDICVVVEKHDAITRAALDRAALPGHMRCVVVPPGSIQTKPRALNYALDFTRGDIVGIWDAEDAPAPDQLRAVAAHFAAADRDVACLQGRLDFYNPADNWLSRAFTIDYATWFRVILPGLSRMGLAVPLGGTTLFFRRDVLEKIGGWDAHNVTEDADLGIRLARMGWRTELIPTSTLEEANCRLWPWVRQRSRWIKGYAITWAVHMRSPRALWSDLGAWRFFGFQAVFLGALSQFVLAPLLWSFWLVLFNLPHPFADPLPGTLVLALATLFLAAELTNIGVGAWACRGARHRWLIPWVPTMHAYFPLAALASWKGLAEIAVRPFFWDKTEHGTQDEPAPVLTRDLAR